MVRVLGRVMLCKDSHPAKAEMPMLVTPSGIVMLIMRLRIRNLRIPLQC